LAFIVAAPRGCEAMWGGGRPLGDSAVVAEVGRLRAKGGDVRVSFGGRAGAELASRCSSVPALTRAYQAVVDRYRLRQVDFDIEGAGLTDRAQQDRRSRAIAALQRTAIARHRPLDVAITLPVVPQGLTSAGLAALRSASRAGARVDHVNLLTMDYGDGAAPSPAGRMGSYAVQAATQGHRQIARVLRLTSRAAWRRLGLTPMVGVNDVSSEVFSVADASTVRRFAQAHRIGLLSMWSLGRDTPCASSVTGAQPDCSGLAEPELRFARALAGR
jgi:hypothetical protein